MRDMVSVDDVVIPIPLTRLKSGALKSESTFPATRFGRSLVLSKRKLTSIVIPATKQVNGLNTGRNAKRK